MCNIIYNIIYIVRACGISGAILSPTYHDIPIYSETNGRRGWTVAAVARFPRRRPNCPEPRKRRNGSTGRRCLPRSRWGRSRKEQTPFERFIMLNHVESCSSFYALLDLGFRDVSFDSLQMVLFFPSPKLGSQSWWSARPLDEPARVMGASTMFFFKSTPKKNVFHWGHIMFPCSMGILCLSQNSLA